MATVTKGRTFVSGETVTPTKLNELVDLATVTSIVDADVSASAAIALSKLATGALPAAITVASANIVDGTIVAADIASGAVTGPKLADGMVVQVVQASNGTMSTVTSIIPIDNTTPTNTEGTEVLSQTITPTSNTNKVLVRAIVPFTTGSAPNVIFAVFRGSTCILATGAAPTSGDYMQIGACELLDAPATTASTTYSVRVGTSGGNTVNVSGYHSLGTTVFNGKYLRTLTLTEIKAS